MKINLILLATQDGSLSPVAKKTWADEHYTTRSAIVLCSAAHVILENQLTVNYLALLSIMNKM